MKVDDAKGALVNQVEEAIEICDSTDEFTGPVSPGRNCSASELFIFFFARPGIHLN